MIQLSGAGKRFGPKLLFENCDWMITPKERTGLVFGWVFAAHQLGAAVAAYGAGLTRTLLLTYNPALFTAGAMCLVAAVSVLAIRATARPTAPATAAAAT